MVAHTRVVCALLVAVHLQVAGAVHLKKKSCQVQQLFCICQVHIHIYILCVTTTIYVSCINCRICMSAGTTAVYVSCNKLSWMSAAQQLSCVYISGVTSTVCVCVYIRCNKCRVEQQVQRCAAVTMHVPMHTLGTHRQV